MVINMKKILAYLLLFSVVSTNTFAADTNAHFVSWGDEEGVTKRRGDDLTDKNEVLPALMQRLTELDKKNPIDAIVHTGDFVRFDPDYNYYKNFIANFLDRFYPTSGGDQEFYLGRYERFISSTPHLKMLYVQRSSTDGNGLEYYYHTIIKNTHIISLYSPDEFRNTENTQFHKLNIYRNTNNEQYKWLENLLFNIRNNAKDERPIIITSHGPVFNYSKVLVELFAKYKVNLVLNGDTHAFAHKKYKGTDYFVTGMMGDRYLGGCEYLDSAKNEFFVEKYDSCFPEKQVARQKGERFYFAQDHFLDINIINGKVNVKIIEIETGKEIKFL